MTYAVNIRGALWTVNHERAKGRWDHRRRTDTMRALARAAAEEAKIPALLHARITAQPYQRRGVLADTGNHYPAVKAAIDGLVDAGLLEDDSPRHVHYLALLPPQRGENGLLLLIEGEPR
ncbi:MAG: hypothetical protein ACOYY2_12925 [Actinomycetota bacterium]